jgi:YegS/Rv2252/BmrU family lipid kinase
MMAVPVMALNLNIRLARYYWQTTAVVYFYYQRSRMKQRKMLLLFNPRAGMQKFPVYLFDVVNLFTAAGFLVTVYPTQAPGEVSKRVAEYAGEMDYLVCSGGDGTIAEAINALIPLKKRPTFALIPSGTVNDFATSLGLPKEILSAAEIITSGVEKWLDIGRFGDRYFSYVAAFGLFTDVSYATPQNLKNMLGNLAYFLEGVRRLGSVQPYRCTFTLDDEVIDGDFILGMVANSQSVGGIKLPEAGVRMDDGLFEVILLQMPENLKDIVGIITSLLQQEEYGDSLIIRKSKKVTFSSPEAVAWTLDGEFGGRHRGVLIENMHKAVKIIMSESG